MASGNIDCRNKYFMGSYTGNTGESTVILPVWSGTYLVVMNGALGTLLHRAADEAIVWSTNGQWSATCEGETITISGLGWYTNPMIIGNAPT